MDYILKTIKKYLRNKCFGCFSKRDRKDLDKYIRNNINNKEFQDKIDKLNDNDLKDILRLRYIDDQKISFIALDLFLTETVVKEKITRFKYYLYGTL